MSVVYSNCATVRYSGNCQDMEFKNSDALQCCHYQQSSGLSRYHSAPSSLLSSLGETSHGCVGEAEGGSTGLDHHHQQSGYVESLGSEMEAMMAKLAAASSNNGWSNVKQEEEEREDSVFCHGGGSGSGSDQMVYHSQEFLGFPSGFSSSSSRAMMNLEISNQSKMGYGNGSNPLMRQKSSPAGFLSNLSLTNGFAAMGEEATTSTSVAFSCRPSPSSSCQRRMLQIAENGSETLNEEPTTTCVQSRNLRDENGCNTSYNNIPSFTTDLWENSAFTAQKTACDNEDFMFSASDALETQHADFGHQNLGLTHQLSLPNSSSSKMAAIERFLQVQGSVPCKIRAKRGFATHPRSIAERVRRSRISERIKKLQELFPKLDKQTSTADMLDLAVDYIKDLQEQVKILTESRAKCSCSSIQKQYS